MIQFKSLILMLNKWMRDGRN